MTRTGPLVALLAAALASRGMGAPENILEGPYGYFANFEGDHDLPSVVESLGRAWRIAEVARCWRRVAMLRM